MIRLLILSLTTSLLIVFGAQSQQVPDTNYRYEIKSPAFPKGSGPKLLLDAVHSPFVRRGSFDPYLQLTRDDGFQVGYLNKKIDSSVLVDTQILVIINAYRENFAEFSAMEPPSAYEDSEIAAIVAWVKSGGRLLLIADHAPFSGGTSKLAEAFGFTFFNGLVLEKDILPFRNGDISYAISYGLNGDSPIIKGGFVNEPVERFMIFAGSAFISPPEATGVLTIPKGFSALIMKTNQSDLSNVPRIDVSGLSQGATLELGTGRVAVFAEAASFSAQIINQIELHGMNNPRADQNARFVLATMRWLAEGL